MMSKLVSAIAQAPLGFFSGKTASKAPERWPEPVGGIEAKTAALRQQSLPRQQFACAPWAPFLMPVRTPQRTGVTSLPNPAAMLRSRDHCERGI
jgi:hypothetical protein